MRTLLAYLDNPLQLEFTATIVGTTQLADQRYGVVLDQTFFYPTGGGQEHDTGTLDDARVMDVTIDDNGTVTHVIDRAIAAETVIGKIDRARRMAFMQHHSAQHLLSATIEQTLGLETVSSKISIDSPTTIDVPARGDTLNLTDAENLANAIIYEDRPIQSYHIGDDQVATIPFRRAPKVSGQIRVVEIAAFDYSACGGTHCPHTGMLGVIKIIKVERRADKWRIYFVAGEIAFKRFQMYHTILTQTARLLDTNLEALADRVAHQQNALHAAQKDLQELEPLRIAHLADQLIAEAQTIEHIKLVTATFQDRTPQQIRALASALQNTPGIVALLAAYDGAKLALTVACANDTNISANDVIRAQLAPISGRGGGDAKLAQGGGALTADRLAAFFADTPEQIRARARAAHP